MINKLERVKLHCYNPSKRQDKIYIMWIEHDTSMPTNEASYIVKAIHGPRGKWEKYSPTKTFFTEWSARRYFEQQKKSKLKKGYKVVDASGAIDLNSTTKASAIPAVDYKAIEDSLELDFKELKEFFRQA